MPGLIPLGDPAAAACEDDTCELPTNGLQVNGV